MSIGVLGPLALVWLCLHSTIASAQDQAFDDEGTLALRYSLKSSALMSRSPDDLTLFPERGTATGFWRGRVEPTWRWSNGITFELAFEQRVRVFSSSSSLASASVLPSNA